MAKEDSNQGATTAVEKGLGIIERAWDAQWALRLTCILLFFDIAMLMHFQRGLWQWADIDKSLVNNVGWLAATFVGLSLVVAIVTPVVLTAFKQIFLLVVYHVWDRYFDSSTDQSSSQSSGYVTTHTFYTFALQEKDDFLWRIYQEHKRNNEESQSLRQSVAQLTATALIASLIDWWYGHITPDGHSVIGVLFDFLGSSAVIVTLIVVMCAIAILKWAWAPSYRPSVIYYPPLASRIREKERRQREL